MQNMILKIITFNNIQICKNTVILILFIKTNLQEVAYFK